MSQEPMTKSVIIQNMWYSFIFPIWKAYFLKLLFFFCTIAPFAKMRPASRLHNSQLTQIVLSDQSYWGRPSWVFDPGWLLLHSAGLNAAWKQSLQTVDQMPCTWPYVWAVPPETFHEKFRWHHKQSSTRNSSDVDGDLRIYFQRF